MSTEPVKLDVSNDVSLSGIWVHQSHLTDAEIRALGSTFKFSTEDDDNPDEEDFIRTKDGIFYKLRLVLDPEENTFELELEETPPPVDEDLIADYLAEVEAANTPAG